MKLDKYEERHKAFIKMEMELNELRDKLRNLPLIPFDKPVHKGWIVTYEMKEEIAKRDDFYDIQQAIDIGYHAILIRNVKHVRMMRAGVQGYWTTDRLGRRQWVSFAPPKDYLKKKQYDYLPPQVKKYFYQPKWWHADFNVGRRDLYCVNLPAGWLKAKPRPHFHTHYEDRGGPLFQRKAFLEDKLEEYWRECGDRWRNKGWSRNSYRIDNKNDIKKFIKHETDDVMKIDNRVYKTLIKR
jgi:hypothetical protein